MIKFGEGFGSLVQFVLLCQDLEAAGCRLTEAYVPQPLAQIQVEGFGPTINVTGPPLGLVKGAAQPYSGPSKKTRAKRAARKARAR